MKGKILTFLLVAYTCFPFCVQGQTQKTIDSLQNLKIEKIEFEIKPIEDLKNNILLLVSGSIVLFGSLTLWNIFVRTKKLVKSKQEEVVKNTTEEILKNLAVQLGMPIEHIRRVLETADKDSVIRSKKLIVLSQKGNQKTEFVNGLKFFDTLPIFKKFETDLDVNGFDVAIIDTLDDSLNDKVLALLGHLDGTIDIVLAVQQGKLDVNRSLFKSKIQFANDPMRIEQAIRQLFV